MAIASAADAGRPAPVRSASSTPASGEIGLRAAARETAQRHAAGRGRRLQHSRRRADARHRPFRLRQVDAVPRHRRHLAVRHRLDLDPGECHADDAAATALFPDRIAAGGDRLSRRSGQRSARTGSRRFSARWDCRSSPRGWRKKPTGIACSRWASSSAWDWRGRCCTRRNICSSTKRPPRSMKPSEAALYRLLTEKLPATTIVSIGHRSTLNAFHQRNIVLVREGDRFALQEARSGQPVQSPAAG